MNKEYKIDFEKALQTLLDNEGLNCLSATGDESFYSHKPCDCCKRPLGGNRTPHNGFNPTEKSVFGDYWLCVDCTLFNAYGELPED